MEFSIIDLVIILAVLLGLIYLYGTWTFDRFSKHGVPQKQPLPFVGNCLRQVLRKENIVYAMDGLYKEFSEHRYFGSFLMRTPTLIIRDPELIRLISVKNFDHFTNRLAIIDGDIDPFFGNNLIALKGQKWHQMRATLSPAFTGSKMRNMYLLVSDCAQQLVRHLKKEIPEGGRKDLDVYDLFSLCTNDVIATAAFGIKVDTLENPNNQFYKMGRHVIDFNNIKMLFKFFGFILMPKVMKALSITFFGNECSNYFKSLVADTMKVREEKGIVRPDMIHLLMQARQGTLQHDNTNTTLTQQQDAGFATIPESEVGRAPVKKIEWTDNDLTSQLMLFFVAGFGAGASMLGFTCHELAVNPDVQKRLQEEIDEFGKDKVPDYESINNLKYLDMVVTEVLRLWSPGPQTDRECSKPFAVEDHKGNKYQINKGDIVLIPIYSIHRDEKYYPNPDKFDPERFSDENKKNIQPYTYLPFGVGPRSCIGTRFALMQMKAILFQLLANYSFEPCAKTLIPMQLSRKTFAAIPENGFWLSMIPRT